MLALHNECLTRRYLPDRLNFLEGLLGFGLGILCVLKGLCPCESALGEDGRRKAGEGGATGGQGASPPGKVL